MAVRDLPVSNLYPDVVVQLDIKEGKNASAWILFNDIRVSVKP